MGEFTPGPWTYETGPSLYGRFHAVHRDDLMICECYEGDGAEREANARLIAAAPALFEALQTILERGYVSESIAEERPDFETARAALAQAKGEA
jgi:hypothetical protein